MASIIVCDGCKLATGKDDYQRLGAVIKKEYCPSCAKVVRAYLSDRDELHTQVAKLWDDGIDSLKALYRESFPEGSLPDENYKA
jgi:hypothetical protein